MSIVSATLAGIRLDFQDLTGDDKAALIRHEYPGQDGADLEFQGWNASEHHLKVFFLADRQQDWQDLRGIIKNGLRMVIQHPEKGDLNGLVESVSTKIDERRDTVEVDLVFVEDGIDTPLVFRPAATDIAAATRESIISDAILSLMYPFGNTTPPSPDLTDSAWLEKLGDLGNEINAAVREMKSGIGKLDSAIAAFTAPVSAALAALDWAADLPNQVAKRMATILDLMQGQVDGAPSPAASATRFLASAKTLAETFAGTTSEGAMRLLVASQGALTVASVMAGDEDRLRAMRAYETVTAFDVDGRWVGRGAQPAQLPATSTQIASLVAESRTLIQAARPWVDDAAELDRLALALQDQFRSRMIEFEQLIEIEVLKPTPLHIICHKYGLAYNMAERLVLLNRIRNPTFVQGRILIYG